MSQNGTELSQCLSIHYSTILAQMCVSIDRSSCISFNTSFTPKRVLPHVHTISQRPPFQVPPIGRKIFFKNATTSALRSIIYLTKQHPLVFCRLKSKKTISQTCRKNVILNKTSMSRPSLLPALQVKQKPLQLLYYN